MKNFNASTFVKTKVQNIKRLVRDRRALVAASGGVDSTVTAILGHRALGPNLVVLFLDTGLMREGEAKDVTKLFAAYKIELQVWDVQRNFFDGLKGLVDPEDKRKAFRDVFYHVLGQALRSYSAEVLFQGTIAADIVETQKGIKTQHNVLSKVGVAPSNFGLKIVEPLKELYKDEVRRVGKALGLPLKIVDRKPFPGPALATRILGEVTPERVEKVRAATVIVESELGAPSIFQAFPVLLNDRATVIRDGKRELGEIVALRAVESKNAITARPSKLPWPKLEKIRDRILKGVPGVVKVVYDITPKPPSTIEYV